MGALGDRGGVGQSTESGNVDRDEHVITLIVAHGGLELIGPRKEAVDARDSTVIGEQQVDLLVGELGPNRGAEPQQGPERIAVGIRVTGDRDGPGVFDVLDDALPHVRSGGPTGARRGATVHRHLPHRNPYPHPRNRRGGSRTRPSRPKASRGRSRVRARWPRPHRSNGRSGTRARG